MMPRTRRIAAGIAMLALAAAASALAGPADGIATTPVPALEANKKLVLDFIREVYEAQNLDNAPKYIARDFIQHKPGAASGLKGFQDWFRPRLTSPRPVQAAQQTEFVEVIAERDLVFLMMKRPLPDPIVPGQTYDSFWFDLFRVRDGMIVEHWDGGLKQPPRPPTAAP